jgi:cell division protein FtsQ
MCVALSVQKRGATTLREQVITQKVGDRAGLYGKRQAGAMTQRPAKRGGRGNSGGNLIERLRAFAHYLPLVGKVALVVVASGLVFAGYRVAASASFFQLRQVDVRGTSRASAEQIQQVVRRTVGQSGVWRADLTAVSTQLERQPWVRSAIVSRLLPDGLRVRITERVPQAVVRTSAGHFVWVDEDAVLLSEMSPTDQMPVFFMRGWSEENSPDARQDNRERVKKYLELTREWSAAGLSERVSEVNLIDLADIRAQLAGDDSQVEVRLGPKEPGVRLKKALEVLDGLKHTPRGALITCVDLSQGKRAVVRFTSGVQISGDQVSPEAVPEKAAKPAAAEPANDETTKHSGKAKKDDAKEKPAARKSESKNRERTRGR